MADKNDNGNGWGEWENAVLQEQSRQSQAILDLTKTMQDFILSQSIEVTKIKVKASLLGLLAGSIPVILAIILQFLH